MSTTSLHNPGTTERGGFIEPHWNNVSQAQQTMPSDTNFLQHANKDTSFLQYKGKSASDIVTEADDLKSMYQTPTQSLRQIGMGGGASSHDCNYLIAKVLACPDCRRKLKELLTDTEVQTMGDEPSQKGGALRLFDWLNDDVRKLIGNLILGAILMLLLGLIMRPL